MKILTMVSEGKLNVEKSAELIDAMYKRIMIKECLE